MSDTQAAMREFRFLDEKRNSTGLTPLEDQRWQELAAQLGVDVSQSAQGYWADDGNWYPYPQTGYDQNGYPQDQYAGGYDQQQQGYAPQPQYDPNTGQYYDPNQQAYQQQGYQVPPEQQWDDTTGQYYLPQAQDPAYAQQNYEQHPGYEQQGYADPSYQQPQAYDAGGYQAQPQPQVDPNTYGYGPNAPPTWDPAYSPMPTYAPSAPRFEPSVPAPPPSAPVPAAPPPSAPRRVIYGRPPPKAVEEEPAEVGDDEVMEVTDDDVTLLDPSPPAGTMSGGSESRGLGLSTERPLTATRMPAGVLPEAPLAHEDPVADLRSSLLDDEPVAQTKNPIPPPPSNSFTEWSSKPKASEPLPLPPEVSAPRPPVSLFDKPLPTAKAAEPSSPPGEPSRLAEELGARASAPKLVDNPDQPISLGEPKSTKRKSTGDDLPAGGVPVSPSEPDTEGFVTSGVMSIAPGTEGFTASVVRPAPAADEEPFVTSGVFSIPPGTDGFTASVVRPVPAADDAAFVTSGIIAVPPEEAPVARSPLDDWDKPVDEAALAADEPAPPAPPAPEPLPVDVDVDSSRFAPAELEPRTPDAPPPAHPETRPTFSSSTPAPEVTVEPAPLLEADIATSEVRVSVEAAPVFAPSAEAPPPEPAPEPEVVEAAALPPPPTREEVVEAYAPIAAPVVEAEPEVLPLIESTVTVEAEVLPLKPTYEHPTVEVPQPALLTGEPSVTVTQEAPPTFEVAVEPDPVMVSPPPPPPPSAPAPEPEISIDAELPEAPMVSASLAEDPSPAVIVDTSLYTPADISRTSMSFESRSEEPPPVTNEPSIIVDAGIDSPPEKPVEFEVQVDDQPLPLELGGDPNEKVELANTADFLDYSKSSSAPPVSDAFSSEPDAPMVVSASLAQMANEHAETPTESIDIEEESTTTLSEVPLASNADFLARPELTGTGEAWQRTGAPAIDFEPELPPDVQPLARPPAPPAPSAPVALGDEEDDTDIIQGVVLEDEDDGEEAEIEIDTADTARAMPAYVPTQAPPPPPRSSAPVPNFLDMLPPPTQPAMRAVQPPLDAPPPPTQPSLRAMPLAAEPPPPTQPAMRAVQPPPPPAPSAPAPRAPASASPGVPNYFEMVHQTAPAPARPAANAPSLVPGPPAPPSGELFDRRGLQPAPGEQVLIRGEHRVILHTLEGQVKRGAIRDADLSADAVALETSAGAVPERIPRQRVKAIFFMLPPGTRPPQPEGQKIRVTFKDGRQVAGFSKDHRAQGSGFFVVPADARTNTARIFIFRDAVQNISVD